MNIKRRVYDALNVLIALGLLKRNGNKILGKKYESETIFFEQDADNEYERNSCFISGRREEALSSELQMLKKDVCTRKLAIR